MSMQEFLKTLKTVKKVYIPLPSIPLCNPNYEIAHSIFKTLITSDSQSLLITSTDNNNTSLLNKLDQTTLQLVLSNPKLKTHKCLEFFTFLQKNQPLIPLKPDPQAHLIIISRLLNSRLFTDAENLAKSLLFSEGITCPFHKLASYVKNCYDNNDDNYKKFVTKLFNLFFKVYSDNGVFDLASETFDYMKSNELEIDERTCTIHLIALKWSGVVELALEFFYRMVEAGIEVSVYSLTVVVDGLCKDGEIQRSRELVEEMIGKGIKPNAITFNILIDACMKRWDFEELDLALGLMEKESVVFSASTYKILIDGYSSSGKIEEAERMISEMHDKGLKVDVYLYTSVINGHCRLGDIETGFLLVNKMIQRRVNPNADTYGILLDGACRVGEMRRAEELVNEMHEKGIELDKVMFSSIINGFCKKGGMVDEAFKWHNVMENKKIIADASLYEILVGELCQLNRTAEKNRMLNMMIKRGMTPNVLKSTTLVEGMGGCDSHKGDSQDE